MDQYTWGFSILATTGKSAYSSHNTIFYLELYYYYITNSRRNGIYRQEPVEKLKKNTPLIVRPLEGTRPQSTFMPPFSQSRGHPDTMNLTELPLGAAVRRLTCSARSRKFSPHLIYSFKFEFTDATPEWSSR